MQKFFCPLTREAFYETYADTNLALWQIACAVCGLVPPPTKEQFDAEIHLHPELVAFAANHAESMGKEATDSMSCMLADILPGFPRAFRELHPDEQAWLVSEPSKYAVGIPDCD